MTDASEASHGWCSLRLRFDGRELELLKDAEQLRGSAFAHTARPEVLRTALSLARAGHKIGAASDGDSISLEHFGASAPGNTVLEQFGFNLDNVVARASALLQRVA